MSWPEEPWNTLLRMVITDWLADEDIYGFLGAAPLSATRLEHNWADGTAPADHYRAHITTLLAVYQAVCPSSRQMSIRRCEKAADRVLDHIRDTWRLDSPDLRSGYVFASVLLTDLFANATPLTARELCDCLRMEIACLAECFRRSRALGH